MTISEWESGRHWGDGNLKKVCAGLMLATGLLIEIALEIEIMQLLI